MATRRDITEQQRPSDGLRRGWLADAIIAGFVATGASTIALVVAYLTSAALAEPAGGVFRVWLWELTNNPVVSFSRTQPALALGVHVLSGLVWALIYAALFEPRLRRPGWQEGLLFALIPWLLSLLVFLPLTGAGLFGAGLGAGILPALGNLLLHLVFGFTLGTLYDRGADLPDTSEDAPDRLQAMELERSAILHSEGFAAAGILGGFAVGAVFGLGIAFVVIPAIPGTDLAGWSIALAVGGALAGGAVGAMVGSFAGLPQLPPDPAEEALGPDRFNDIVASIFLPIAVLLLVLFGIVAPGMVLLSTLDATHNKLIPVAVALVLTTIVGVAAWVLASRADTSRPSHGGSAHHG